MRSPLTRIALSFASLATWLLVLLFGWSAPPLAHLPLLLAAILFPWRLLRVEPTEPSVAAELAPQAVGGLQGAPGEQGDGDSEHQGEAPR